MSADIAIIGGGITGMTAAYLLRGTGKSVVLLEKDSIGSFATGSTTGFLMDVLDTHASTLISGLGIEKAKAVTGSHRDAIRRIEEIVRYEKIACEFMRCSAYLYARNAREAENLKKEATELAEVGIEAEFMSDSLLALENQGYLEVKRQAKFHSLKYLFAIAEICSKSGIRIFEQSEVTSIEKGATPVLHTTKGFQVTAGKVLMATHYPMNPQPGKLRFKKAWYTTYVLEAWIPAGTLPEGLYEDAEVPYHYARVDAFPGRDRLIIGGEDHRSDLQFDEKKIFARLRSYVKTILPGVPFEVTRQWKGRIVEPVDGLASIGPLSDGIFYATGYSGTGLTYGTIAAQSFAAYAMGTSDPFQGIYAADRGLLLKVAAPKGVDYLQELASGILKNVF